MLRMTRRRVLAGTGAGAMVLKPAAVFGSAANSAVSLGIIGTGGRGQYVGGHMLRGGWPRLAAICDIYPDRIDQAKTNVPGADKARVYRDYKELLAQPDIDAVLITTPVFLHPEHFEAAVAAKKHIYCEKPAAPDVAGVKRVMRAAGNADPSKVIQWGFQQRFSPEYLRAKAMVDGGQLGEVKMMLSYWILGDPPPVSFTPKYTGEEAKIRYWGRWTETSGGPIVEQDCHGVDMLNWFARARPLRAVGKGGLRYPVVYGDWTSDHHNIIYSYPGGIEGWLISVKHAAGFRDVREQFYGSKGMVETARTYLKIHGPSDAARLRDADKLEDRSLLERVVTKREITIDAVEHFFTKIQKGEPYDMTDVAVDSTFTSLLGRMAYEYEREVTWEEMFRSA
jgi:predicted dehydrogenase